MTVVSWQYGPKARKHLYSALSADNTNELARAVIAYSISGHLSTVLSEIDETIKHAQENGEANSVVGSCLDAVDSSLTVIIEHGYIDIDNRSEYAVNIVRQFRFDPIINDRLHFFSAQLDRAANLVMP